MTTEQDRALVRQVNDERKSKRMSTQLATQSKGAQIERVMIENDLSALTPEARVTYYREVCETLGLNWVTRPFSYIQFQGKTVLYANKDATEQLRRRDDVSITKLERDRFDDVYVVTAYAMLPSGRTDSST